GLGLQVHDVAGFAASDAGGTIDRPDGHPYLRLTRTLAPGMVATIEPGLYFADMLMEDLRAGDAADRVDWARIDALRRFGGVRIEGNVVCTDDAPLTLPREACAALSGAGAGAGSAGHEGLDLVGAARQPRGEHLVPVTGDRDVVLDADADPAPAFGHAG